MTDLVPPEDIERIVGHSRHPNLHIGRAVSEEEVFYILHSQECRDNTPDPRDCPYSKALEPGINMVYWEGFEDIPVLLMVRRGRLWPVPFRSEEND